MSVEFTYIHSIKFSAVLNIINILFIIFNNIFDNPAHLEIKKVLWI